MKTICRLLLWLQLCAICAVSFAAETNHWVNSSGGFWVDSSNWSLGKRPGAGQIIEVNGNAPLTLSINSSNAADFPDSLLVSQISIARSNVLFLDRIGEKTPLQADPGTNRVEGIQLSGFLVAVESKVLVGGFLRIAGGQWHQDGGIVDIPGGVLLHNSGAYYLTNGVFSTGNMEAPSSGLFQQSGGRVDVSSEIRLTDSKYFLESGEVNSGWEVVRDYSLFRQRGGTNRTGSLSVIPYTTGQAHYSLEGGLLLSSNVYIQSFLSACTFDHSEGTHLVADEVRIAGSARYYPPVSIEASYNLGSNAVLAARAIRLDNNGGYAYLRSTGRVSIAESVRLTGSSNYLSSIDIQGGSFSCSNLLSEGAAIDIRQNSGGFSVSNLFSFSGYYPGVFDGRNARPARFDFAAGSFHAGNIELRAEWIIGPSSTPGRISNPGYFKLAGIMRVSDADERFGRLMLAGESRLDFRTGKARLVFASSEGEAWNPGAVLILTNWNGSLGGGGEDQIRFGTNARALSQAQLRQVHFSNPSGLPPGEYPAVIREDGEIVPARTPLISLRSDRKKIVLQWGGELVLQSATNVAGPYSKVQFVSPYTNEISSFPQRFFRWAVP